MKKTDFLLCFLLLFLIKTSNGQSLDSIRSIHIIKTTDEIIIDGIENESAWQHAESAGNFYRNNPDDNGNAKSLTTVKLLYDEKNIYVLATCYEDATNGYIIQSLKRDYSFPISDAFAISIDPFGDKTNGFNFGVNAVGAQREGLLSNGGNFGVTTDWDNKWFSKVTNYSDHWVAEMAIPFKSLRYNKNLSTWYVNFLRNDQVRNEISSWVHVPRVYNVGTLAFTGQLIWDTPPPEPGTNIAFIPFGISSFSVPDFSTSKKIKTLFNTGFDAKIGITSSLNLDITVNPDFSQVEVDKQVTNLTRFNIYYPEKRNFFIENSDLFAQFGFRQIRPFFSRQIGISNGMIIPILAGIRLSGKVNENWRIGIMSLQTKAVDSLNLKSQNYTVMAVQRKIFSRSNLEFIVVNRQAINNSSTESSDYNRVGGLEFDLQTTGNKYTGKVFYFRSLNTDTGYDAVSHATWLLYSSHKFSWEWNHEYVGENFISDVGFIPRLYNYDSEHHISVRKSYWRFEPVLHYLMYANSEKINYLELVSHGSLYLNKTFSTTEQTWSLAQNIYFKNSASILLVENYNLTRLIFNTDVTGSGGTLLPAGFYKWNDAQLTLNSNTRKKLNANTSVQYGNFYNGKKFSYSITASLRTQPWGIWSLNFSQDHVTLPDPYKGIDLYLIGPKFEFAFTRSLYFTTFFQYNTQIKNFNINGRLQWRFKPMSDLYIVYTDNYDTIHFGPKNKALVIKLNYWFSL